MSLIERSRATERGLAAAQRWLFQRVTRPLGAPSDAADDARWVMTRGRLSGNQGIAVYQRGYFARLVECLRDDYPALAHAAGSDEFEALCLEFIEAHPPASPSLNFYGARFAEFCATWHAPHAAFWSELARLEWAIVECIHADAERSLDPRELAALTEQEWSRVWLVPSPASRILTASYPVHAYYRAFLDGESPVPPASGACTIAVSRRGDRVWRLDIDARWAPLLERLTRGEPLASALASVAPAATDDSGAGAGVAGELERALSEWVSSGLFAGVCLGQGPRFAR